MDNLILSQRSAKFKQFRFKFLKEAFLAITALATFSAQSIAHSACSQISTQASTTKFINNTNKSVKVYWVNFLCGETLYNTLSASTSYTQGTFTNHVWRFRDASSNSLIRELKISSTDSTVLVTPPSFSLALTGPSNAVVNTPYAYTVAVKNTSTTIASADTIKLSTTLPSGLNFVASGSGSPGGFTCSSVSQVVTCNRTSTMAANAADTVTINVKPTLTGSKSTSFTVSGGGNEALVASNTVTTSVQNPPDLTVSIRQPNPALIATAMSQVEVRISNVGYGATITPTNVTFTLPANVTAPTKFSRVADNWLCSSNAQTVSCSYKQSLASGSNTRLRIPVIPADSTLNTTPGPFTASVAPASGETNIANNGPVNMTPNVAVTSLALTEISDPRFVLPILDPTSIPKYALPLPNMLAPFFKHTPNTTSNFGADTYTLDIKKVKAQVLPPGFPATNVFAYGDPNRLDTFTYPAHTIEARSTANGVNDLNLGKPTKVNYLNTLTTTAHVLDFNDPINGIQLQSVDHSITGTFKGPSPDPDAPVQPLIPESDVRSVAHLHGAKSIDASSNGYPEAWFSPIADPMTGLHTIDTPLTSPTVAYNPSPFNYPNNQESAMLWYHDNALGLSRLNVYAGLAGLYLIRDDNEMTMISNNQLPSGPHEVPLILQDRMFHADGSFAYPDTDAVAPPPSWVKESSADVMVVNGVAWPYLQVEPRKYRFRMLNASNARFYTLSLRNNAAMTTPINFQVIGTDGGFLNAPTTVSSITIAPGERYDIIVDFKNFKGKNLTLKNTAGTPFGAAGIGGNGGEVPPTDGLQDQLMQFRVNLPQSSAPTVTLPTALRTAITPLVPTPNVPVRKLLLTDVINAFSRVKPLLGTAEAGPALWQATTTEAPMAGTVETWEIYNNTVNTHDIHLHGVAFQVINRQAFNATLGALNAELKNDISFPSAAIAPSPSEQGWKDTVIVPPSLSNNPSAIDGDIVNGQVTRIRVKFDTPGQFEWNCQLMDHQDHEMERPLSVH